MKKLAGISMLVGVCVVAWSFAGVAFAGTAEQPRYRYVPLNEQLPPEFIDSYSGLYPFKVNNKGVVYGTGFAYGDPVNFTDPCWAVLEWRDGALEVIYRGLFLAHTANEFGLIGGGVFDFETYTEKAALLYRGRLTMLDHPGESSSYVARVTNTAIALVRSETYEPEFVLAYRLYRLGRTIPVAAGLTPSEAPLPSSDPDINDLGVIGGSAFLSGQPPDVLPLRAIRVAPSGRSTILDPIPPNNYSDGKAINSRGDVLGYSRIRATPLVRDHRIGVWRGKTFQTYHELKEIAGVPNYLISDLGLLWNERGLIVALEGGLGRTFILPKPGERIDLADVVENESSYFRFNNVTDLNELGDMTGWAQFDIANAFLLERLDPDDRQSQAATVLAREAAPGRRPARAVSRGARSP
jgi:hypothetical protein